ncbi:uncharacterized protein L201_006417 [Kwoniella dendrophila CBS 6074]|uniref:Autophagy-related protein 16 domain-containing protein n=1 Tax=Kwoniella dendrophila CBS 6074 TaxID=1295534 RepID=A0AAX4K168_9TREE
MPLFANRRDTQNPAPIARQPVDLKKLLAVYDDYPNVLGSLDQTMNRLEESEESQRIAEEKMNDALKDLDDERKGREKDNKASLKAKEEALALSKKEKLEAEKLREEKIRNELNPKITKLETDLKTTTEHRDRLEKELKEKNDQMVEWITLLEKLSLERKQGYEKEKKLQEERWLSEEKTQKLDQDILEKLRESSRSKLNDVKSVNSDAISVKSHQTHQTHQTRNTTNTTSRKTLENI